jgi:hypothetical protein
VEWLAGELHALYDREAGALLADPWAARDACGDLDAQGGATTAAVVAAHARRALSAAEVVRARELLEMERNALRLFTSCAWFFDDVGGLEPLQVLRYAARAIELSGAPPSLEAAFAERLAAATSNDPAVGDAARIYRERARPAQQPPVLVAGSHAVARGAVPDWPTDRAYAYDVEESGDDVRLIHRRTGRAETFTVRVERPAALQARVTVAPAGGGVEATLQLADLLERERSAVVAAGAAALGFTGAVARFTLVAAPPARRGAEQRAHQAPRDLPGHGAGDRRAEHLLDETRRLLRRAARRRLIPRHRSARFLCGTGELLLGTLRIHRFTVLSHQRRTGESLLEFCVHERAHARGRRDQARGEGRRRHAARTQHRDQRLADPQRLQRRLDVIELGLREGAGHRPERRRVIGREGAQRVLHLVAELAQHVGGDVLRALGDEEDAHALRADEPHHLLNLFEQRGG